MDDIFRLAAEIDRVLADVSALLIVNYNAVFVIAYEIQVGIVAVHALCGVFVLL